MDTLFLNTFVSVVERGSMAAAARVLDITPAAVAQQIRTLEREIGVPLIARVGRTVSVTEEGARILDR
ncbi:MAG: LysR family transcriptional regulator, partial [Rudaea sp.]|nr:LysR family transcriptional regulator [Rudaea sp.]